ncbi:hypothetical protein [Chiayiivirga flava]|uniref:Uncharacterized protein n=1 Tax=Chiayiivirga flava TaxID=659595 RepID=A0A7W8DA60_9GAMM|nr:hypothetical protein [Chiayiivirga flava]MBB5209582.1 hypothetical protein [Chiayiivirga flava]
MHAPTAIAREAARLLGATAAAPRDDVGELAAAAADLLGDRARPSDPPAPGGPAEPPRAPQPDDRPTGASKRPASEDCTARAPSRKVSWLQRLFGRR